MIEVGSQVRLLRCPYGAAGVVKRIARGKAEVWWADLGFTGKHSLDSLIPISH